MLDGPALCDQAEYNGHEIIAERPDGERLTLMAYANPIHDDSGKLLGAVNVLVDISERKRAEVENARLCTQLQEADRRKDEFLATLAHELRNPLAPIRNAVQILRTQGPLDPTLQWARDVIDRQVHQMARLVDDLLDLSRITGARWSCARQRLDLREVLHAAVETSRPLIEACGHDLVVALPSEPICLDGDLTRLAQVVSNLLNNAAKYTERGGRIWLTAERQGSDAVVTVRDTGIGIRPEMLSRIFEMFTQVDRTLERSHGGLGIGLTLVKQLVEMHGGSIRPAATAPAGAASSSLRLPVVLGAASLRRSAGGEWTCAGLFAPHPGGGRQSGRGGEPGDAAAHHGPRGTHRPRRPGGREAGGRVPPPGGPARHRPARPERP